MESKLLESVQEFFAPGGQLSRTLPRYEYRDEQVQMGEAVARAVAEGKNLMVEAGTGVGKSLGYLVPVILWARENDKRVFVATGTKTLQHQLMEKELPFLKRHLQVDFLNALAVGADNYLCQRRLATAAESDQQELFGDATELKSLSEWSGCCQTGLKSDLDVSVSNQTWFHVCRIPELCSGQDCGHGGNCFYGQARKQMSRADILVGNHHLLFANLRADWEYLPKCDVLVVDEVHNLDTVASDCLGVEFSHRALRRVWEGLRGKDGEGCLIGSLLEIPIEQRLGLLDTVRAAEEQFNESIQWFHDQVLAGKPRVSVAQDDAVRGLDHFIEPLSGVVAALRQLSRKITIEETRIECEGYTSRLERVLSEAKMITEMQPEAPWLLWCEEIAPKSREDEWRSTSDTAALRATPLDPGGLLQERLYSHFQSNILVSATLSTGGDFSHIQNRLGTGEALAASLPSPFNFKENLLVYTPRDVPAPTEFDAYIAEVTDEVARLSQAGKGGVFVLCTSYKILNALFETFRERVPIRDYRESVSTRGKTDSSRLPALRQGDAPREKLLDLFKSEGRAVLFAAATFWQGVDVPGTALETVVITRLPFQPPDDPVLEAKISRCRKKGGNPFLEIQVPQAVMQFRQGIGRLIRSHSDRGVIAILDSRVLTKQYGNSFLSSIPECEVTESLDRVKEFLGGGGGP